MRRAHPEEAAQKSILQFLAISLPADALVWHTPNQRGTRAKWETALLRGLGVVPGIPDLLCLIDGRLYGFEVKSKSGSLTEAQKLTQGRMVAAGAKVAVVRSVEEVERCLRAWGVILRATVITEAKVAA